MALIWKVRVKQVKYIATGKRGNTFSSCNSQTCFVHSYTISEHDTAETLKMFKTKHSMSCVHENKLKKPTHNKKVRQLCLVLFSAWWFGFCIDFALEQYKDSITQSWARSLYRITELTASSTKEWVINASELLIQPAANTHCLTCTLWI